MDALVSFSPIRVENEYADWRDRLAQSWPDPSFITITYIDERLDEGRAFFLGTTEAAMVVELLEYPGGAKVVSVLAAAGDKDEITGRLGDRAMQFGRDLGCTHALVPGRPGWKRERPDFLHFQTILYKEL